jgi:hypothetical protein
MWLLGRENDRSPFIAEVDAIPAIPAAGRSGCWRGCSIVFSLVLVDFFRLDFQRVPVCFVRTAYERMQASESLKL